MSALVADTSSWIAYLAGKDEPELESALNEARVIVPPIVVAEIFSGNLRPADRGALISLFSDLRLADTPLKHWLRVGETRQRLLRRGFSVSTPDAHIAQVALDYRAELLSHDTIFAKIAKPLALRMC